MFLVRPIRKALYDTLPLMNTYLTTEQRNAIDQSRGEPVIAIDRVLQQKYVILPIDDYYRLVETLVESGVSPDDVFRSRRSD